MVSVVTDEQARAELATDLDELVGEGGRRLLAAALEAEVDADLAAHAELVDERGHRLVVRNGHAPARTLTTAAGQVEVVRPRVDDRRVDPDSGQRVQFQSVVLPRWCRRSPKVAAVLPLRYWHGLSSMDLVPALEGCFGAAAGLSASVITRLAAQWQAERPAFARRDLHAGARRVLNEITGAEDRAHAERAIQALVSADGATWPKAVATVTDDAEALLCFLDIRPSTGGTCAAPTPSSAAARRSGPGPG
jgi:hypothetical protein